MEAHIKKNAIVSTTTGATALIIQSIKRRGDELIMDGKALGTMRMDMVLTWGEFCNLLKIACCWGVISYILLFPVFCIIGILRKNNA